MERLRQLIFKGTVTKRNELYKERSLENVRVVSLRVSRVMICLYLEEGKERTRNPIG